MPRAPLADDLYALRVPTDVRLSPDGRWVCFGVKSVAPGRDGYRQALWLVPADAAAPPRQLTLGAKNDSAPRWSPDGRTLAFLSDRAAVLQAGGGGERPGTEEPKDGATQVWLLPLDGGEARQLTRLPRDVGEIAWSPDGARLCVTSSAMRADGPPPAGVPKTPRSGIRGCSTACSTSSTASASSMIERHACGSSTSPMAQRAG